MSSKIRRRIISFLLMVVVMAGALPVYRADKTYAGVSSNANETTIFNFLMNDLHLNAATASGILANVYKESGFNPKSQCIDTNGKVSYGLVQWNGGRYEALKKWCSQNGYSYSSVEGQLKYLQYELGSSENTAWKKMQGIPNTASGAYKAGYNWATYFERCAAQFRTQRAILARDTFWPSYSKYSDSTPPVMTNVYIEGKDQGGFMINVTARDDAGIKNVIVTSWNEKLGKQNYRSNQMIRYSTTNQYRYYVAIKDFENSVGIYHNELIAYDNNSNKSAVISIDAEIPDTTPPIMKNAKIEGQDDGGYMLNVTVTDDVEIENVIAESWSNALGKSRAKQQNMIRRGNTNEYRLYVPYKEFNNAKGVYHNNLIAYDRYKNKTVISIDAFASSNANSAVRLKYRVHVQNLGDLPWQTEGIAGTEGKALRLEAYEIILQNPDGSSAISYRSHVSNVGWQNWMTSGATSGTCHQSKAIEAIQIKLTGELAKEYNIYYRLHLKDKGWTEYKCNGAVCGTTGEARRAEALEIRLEKK